MPTKLISFGFKHGQPTGNTRDITVIDIRQEPIPNPYYYPELRHLKGTDPAVKSFLDRATPMSLISKLRSLVLESQADTVYIGCTGGHHRSVYLVERLGKELGLQIEHRDISKP